MADSFRQVVDPAQLGIGALFYKAPDAIIVADIETDTIVLWNPTAERMFGYAIAEAIGMPIATIAPERLRAMHRAGMARYKKSGHGKVVDSGNPVEVPALRKSGEEFWIELTLSPLDDAQGNRAFILSIIRDITDRKIAQDELKLATDELSRMNAELTDINRMKDQFLSILSHELRTPINAIMGFGSILDDEVAGPLNEEQHRYLRRMLGGADTLLMLVNDLLDMSRIQAGKFTLEPRIMDMGSTALEVADSLRPLAEQRRQTLLTEIPHDLPHLRADKQRITQILTNLVNNAIKFTDQGGTISLHVSDEGPRLRCEVRDSGIGLSDGDMKRLFKPFTQVDSSNSRRAGGTGLGLAICKALVEAHGGEIGVESELGIRSTFWFSLPVEA